MIKTPFILFCIFIILFNIDPPVDYWEQGSSYNREKFGYLLLKFIIVSLYYLWLSSYFNKSKENHKPKIAPPRNKDDLKSEIDSDISTKIDSNISNISNKSIALEDENILNTPALQLDIDSSINGQVKAYAFYIWMIIPTTLFLPWNEIKPSDNGGSAFGLIMIGFLVFIVSSSFLAKKVYIHRLKLDNSTQILGYSPFVSASFLLIVFTISL